VSVASSVDEPDTDYYLWRHLSEYAALPRMPSDSGNDDWPDAVADVLRVARAAIWSLGDNSSKQIGRAIDNAITLLHGESTKCDLRGWQFQLQFALERDPLVISLPTSDGVDEAKERLGRWWADHWASADKSDSETTLALTESLAEIELSDCKNKSDAMLAIIGFLVRLRANFPDSPLTYAEFMAIKHKRRVRAIGERFSTGMNDDLKSQFFAELDRMADGFLSVPCSGDAREEAKFASSVFCGDRLNTCKLAAALLQTAHAVHVETSRVYGIRIHPIHGYGMAFDDESSVAADKLCAVSPGLWRLALEGDQYIITCELWPQPVVMSPNEFGRARGSANAILRDVGIAVDSPPGHWKAVWESHGLRSQLLATAERIDPRLRIEEFKAWVGRVALAAPTADRPPPNGAAVRLADGATVASCQWLIGQAAAEGVIRPHEHALFERTLRQAAKETNRRDTNRVQQRLLTIDAVGEPAGIPLNNKGVIERIENREEA
jgi:hypothetical protein